MNRHQSELSDEQGENVSLPARIPSLALGGPKPVPNRPGFEGILWVLRSNARCKDLPASYLSPSTCWRPSAQLGRATGLADSMARLARTPRSPRPTGIGPKPLPTAALPRPKKGALCRRRQEGLGYEVEGGGRRPRSSFGKPPGIGVPG